VHAAPDTRQTGNGCTNILLQYAHLNSKARYFPTRMRARNITLREIILRLPRDSVPRARFLPRLDQGSGARKKRKRRKREGAGEGGRGGGWGTRIKTNTLGHAAARARSLAGSQEVLPRLIDKPKKSPSPSPPLPLAPGIMLL